MSVRLATTILAIVLGLVSNASAGSITSKPSEYLVEQDDTVTVVCQLDGVGADDTVMWRKGASNEPLFIGTDSQTGVERYTAERNATFYSLRIAEAQPIDSGAYECMLPDEAAGSAEETSSEISEGGQTYKRYLVRHRVVVLVPPAVRLQPDSDPYPLKEGDRNVILRCSAEGNPVPNVEWTRIDGQFAPGTRVDGNRLILDNVTQSVAGTYLCSASNSVGKAQATTNIVVNEAGRDGGAAQVKPWVKTNQTYVPVRVGQQVRLICTYDGTPSPQVAWLYNNFNVNSDQNLKSLNKVRRDTKGGFTESELIIDEIRADHFGHFACRVANFLGTVSAQIFVSARPGPPTIYLDERDDPAQALRWELDSMDDVIEYKILYRVRDDPTFDNFTLIRANKGSDQKNEKTWTASRPVVELLPCCGTYEVQIEARNSHGWGFMARDYKIVERTAREAERANADTPDASSQRSLSAVLLILTVLSAILRR